jgi:hypothetical protein
MEKLTFSILINAPRQTVWDVLWNESTYPEWTRPFCEGSHMVTDLKEGSKVLFLDSNGSGMVSRVAVNRPNDYMDFEHLGEVKDGIEDADSEQVKSWAGAHETYTLTDAGNQTQLVVNMDTTEEFKEYFLEPWPKAMDKIKELAEKRGEK